MANFGMVGVDWQERINWDRRQHGSTDSADDEGVRPGIASVCNEENIRHITATLTAN
jgi:hypothetical protein